MCYNAFTKSSYFVFSLCASGSVVEYNLAKVGVAGSIPVSRSSENLVFMRVPEFRELAFCLHNATCLKFLLKVFIVRLTIIVHF